MKYCKLRIAWSVMWGIACLLLTVLWVRSFWWADWVVISRPIGISSAFGTVWASASYDNASSSGTISTDHANADYPTLYRNLGFGYQRNDSRKLQMWIPYWFVVLAAGLIASAPWLPWRFSLRTLLIGMTVAAIGLGWIVYALRS